MIKRLILFVFIFILAIQTQSQHLITDHTRDSFDIYVYKANSSLLRDFHLRGKLLNEQNHGKEITRYKATDKIPSLKRGNYLLLQAQKNQLMISEHIVDNMLVTLVPDKKLMICLYDSTGNIISDAIVKCGHKILKFNTETQTYSGSVIRKEKTVEINHKGVFHYIRVDNDHQRYYKKSWYERFRDKVKNQLFNLKYNIVSLFNKDYRPYKTKYKGFIVFNKPAYKPNEAVKLKAYITKTDGTPYTKPVSITLRGFRTDSLINKSLYPYRPGMFEYEFKLTDRMNLSLNKSYTVCFGKKDNQEHLLSDSFRYEEYNLKSALLSLSTNRDEHFKGDSLAISVKVTDTNLMPVYGGKALIVVTPLEVRQQECNRLVYIPDTLWKKDIDMTESAEAKIYVPDSIFPENTSLSYRINCSYLGADNEKRINTKRIIYHANTYILDTNIKDGYINIAQLKDGRFTNSKAMIRINNQEYVTDSVRLPYSFPLPWYASSIEVTTPFSSRQITPEANEATPVKCILLRENDSVTCKVENPSSIPFWYQIRKGKRDLLKGHSDSLYLKIPDPDKAGYEVSVSYISGGKAHQTGASLPYFRKNISMDVTASEIVYPGQKTNIRISLKDTKNKPVENADITAFAITSKFNKNIMPNLPVQGKAYYARKIKMANLKDKRSVISTSKQLNWGYWKQKIQSDTIEFYKFLYPEKYYKTTAPSVNNTTLLMPFIVKDGEAQGIQLLWIDGVLHYSSITDQIRKNIFEVTPGIHNLKIRTYRNEIDISNVVIDRGVKNIYSFNIGANNWKSESTGEKEPLSLDCRIANKGHYAILSEKELTTLSKELISIENTCHQIELPNSSLQIELPSYVRSGNNYQLLNYIPNRKFPQRTYGKKPSFIAGPFPATKMNPGFSDFVTFCNEPETRISFIPEGGYSYTFFENYQKVKNWEKIPFLSNLRDYSPSFNFKQDLYNADSIRIYSQEIINNTLSSLQGLAAGDVNKKDKDAPCKLSLTLGNVRTGEKINPLLIVYKPGESDLPGPIFYGGSRYFNNLPEGKGSLYLIFGDSSVYTTDIRLQKNGNTYLSIDSIETALNQEIATYAFTEMKKNIRIIQKKNPYIYAETDNTSDIGGIRKASKSELSGIITDSSGEPVAGAAISVIGTQCSTISNIDGEFSIQAKAGDKLRITYIGCNMHEIDFVPGNLGRITLTASSQNMDNVSVTAYGAKQKTKSDINESGLNSVLTGMVRGINSSAQLIIVNGLPYNGSLADFDHTSISNTTSLEGPEAIQLFGNMAAGGVIILEGSNIKLATNNKVANLQIRKTEANNIRRNFHDDAFWQPRLRTDKNGVAEFEVTYPDDITRWDACFIAIGNRKQSDRKIININAFKSLIAQLSLPKFAIAGDQINGIGHITNYKNNSIKLVRRTCIDGTNDSISLRMKSSLTERIPFNANGKDSVSVSYEIKSESGYKDGEKRVVPVYNKGLMKLSGEFRILNDSDTHIFTPDPASGPVTFYAETTPLDFIIREIQNIDNFPFYCNEQIASKIKVLIARKRIARLLNEKFKDDAKIRSLIRRLEKNQNQEGLWGWWDKSATQFWISEQVIEALTEAGKEGYASSFRKKNMATVLESQIARTLHNLSLNHIDYDAAIKNQLINQLVYLKQSDPEADLSKYVGAINQLKNLSVSNKLKSCYIQTILGSDTTFCVDSIMQLSGKTILGSVYWGEADRNSKNELRYRNPCLADIENTLLAYRLLKSKGADQTILASVRSYFFETASNREWSNTYVSSRIIETILPDILSNNKTTDVCSVTINNHSVKHFPYACTLNPDEEIVISKDCATPVFITYSQMSLDENPSAESSKGFSIYTSLNSNPDSLCHIRTGESIQLNVNLRCTENTNYVQIEIPVPAGCEYDMSKTKRSEFEIHREYFKDKVVIFCNSLPKGEHLFSVALLPRFTGKYTINPAKAELMYFPVFFGNNEIKTLRIDDSNQTSTQ